VDYQAFKRQLARSNISNKEFAALLCLNSNSIANYSKTGRVPPHLAIIATLIGALVERNIDYKTLIKDLQIEPKKPRGDGGLALITGTNAIQKSLI
jgi:hypothetical protein